MYPRKPGAKCLSPQNADVLQNGENEKVISIQRSLITKLDINTIEIMYSSGMTQTEIAQEFGVSQKVIWRFMKNNGISARVAAKRNQYGTSNSSWKGERATYYAFHSRVYTKYGPARAYGCCICGANDPGKSYDWANISGDYNNPDDFAPMCRPCHRQFDAEKKVIKCPN